MLNKEKLACVDISRLGLGAAQFGLDYGIANKSGQVSLDEARDILTLARSAGLDTIDTAMSYGRSEDVLGAIGVESWQVYTKLPELPEAVLDDRARIRPWVAQQVNNSLTRLRLRRVAGLMLHRPSQLGHRNGAALYEAVCAERDFGRTGRIGVSVYGPHELDAVPEGMTWDIVQAPVNVLDMGMITSGWLDRLAANDCALHARSVFLQGLLLLPAAQKQAQFAEWEQLWQAWDRFVADLGITRVEACIRHVMNLDGVERVVVGVTSVSEFTEIINVSKGKASALPKSLITQDERLLNPSRWPVQ
jgi:aryl-alcohol dehydrogenase-like predicted oxidoreductase